MRLIYFFLFSVNSADVYIAKQIKFVGVLCSLGVNMYFLCYRFADCVGNSWAMLGGVSLDLSLSCFTSSFKLHMAQLSSFATTAVCLNSMKRPERKKK